MHDHPVRGRVNAAFFNVMGGYLEWLLRHHKPRVLAGLGPRVVEIGPGVGANLRHYPAGTDLLAVEPDRRMHPHPRRHATAADIDLRTTETGAETMDAVPAASTTWCPLSCCAPSAIRLGRWRRSHGSCAGGRFRFVEHIAAAPGSATGRIQDAVKRPRSSFFAGCCVDRCNSEVIERGPFRSVDHDRFTLRSPFVPANPGMAGIAVKMRTRAGYTRTEESEHGI